MSNQETQLHTSQQNPSAATAELGDLTADAKMAPLSLLVGISIMVVGSLFPWVFADAKGHADHGIATALFWAMSAGIVRGVGFVPKLFIWRWLFSGWACLIGIALAVYLRFFTG